MGVNRKRLIDADALLQSEIKRCRCVPLIGSGYKDETSFKLILDQAPSVDAVEVVHGRWVEKIDMVTSYLAGCEEVFYECSVCNSASIGETNYCPNCGAKMEQEVTA